MHIGQLTPAEWRAVNYGMARARADFWAHRARVDDECGRKVLAEQSRDVAMEYEREAQEAWEELARVKGEL